MASTQKLPSGRFRGIYRDADGNRRYTPATARKSDALDAAIDAQAKAKRSATPSHEAPVSARTPWGRWWEHFDADREFVSDSGRIEEQNVRLHLEPQWGQTPLNRITQHEVQRWVDSLGRRYAPSYVRRVFGTFSVSIHAAVDRGVLGASPIAGVRLPRKVRKPKPFVSADELDALLNQLPGPVRDAVVLLADTGLRPNELTGLHAHRLDLDAGWLTVAETYIYGRQVVRPYPKDREARSVPLTARAVEAARRALDGRDLRAGCGLDHVDGQRCRHPLVFRAPKGGPLTRDRLMAHLRRAAEAAELDPRSGYAVRRGFATRLADAGLDIFTIADLMGHEDVNLTREYAQQSADVRTRTLSALGDRGRLAVVSSDTAEHESGVRRRETPRETDLGKPGSGEVPSSPSGNGNNDGVTSGYVS